MRLQIKTLESLPNCTKRRTEPFPQEPGWCVGFAEWGDCLLGKLFTHSNLHQLWSTTMAGPSVRQYNTHQSFTLPSLIRLPPPLCRRTPCFSPPLLGDQRTIVAVVVVGYNYSCLTISEKCGYTWFSSPVSVSPLNVEQFKALHSILHDAISLSFLPRCHKHLHRQTFEEHPLIPPYIASHSQMSSDQHELSFSCHRRQPLMCWYK